MDLETLSFISQIVGTLTIVGGAVFALVQFYEVRRQRHEQRAAELMRGFMDANFSDAVSRIRTLPDGVSAEELRRAGPEVERDAVRVCMSLETMGLMVYRRVVPLDLVVELAGGMSVVIWRKLGPWLVQTRIEQKQPSWAEWFQWLAQQCEKHKGRNAPAYERLDWRP
jgi:hypothetical protein